MKGNTQVLENAKINSAELQKAFSSVYKKFFNAHDIVLSGNNILTWGTDISHGISTLRIKQKLPTKTFCGVNINNSGKIVFREFSYYSAQENLFKTDEFQEVFRYDLEEISRFLQEFLVQNNYFQGVDIDFLAEVPPGHGFASSGSIAVLLAHLVYVILGKINIDASLAREFSLESEIFEEVYRLSLQISHRISGGKSIGASNYAVMISGVSLPIVHLSHKGDSTDSDDIIFKNTLSDFLDIEVVRPQDLLLDYGVIFAGMSYKFHQIESTRELVKKENDRLNAFITRILESLPVQEVDRSILSDILNFNEGEISRQNIDNTNFRILEGFDYLIRNEYNDGAVRAFIHMIQSIGLLSFACQEENRLFFAIVYLFHQYKRFEDEEIGIYPFNTGKIGGSLFFVLKYEKSRNTIERVLEHLKNDGYIVSFDYTSWRDGSASSGICLDQYIGQKLYSDYTKEGNALFYDTLGAFYSGDYDAIIEKEKDCMLLDTIRGKIYMGGDWFTSKDIHSQNTAIDMLKILIENPGSDVPNSKLPVSTYSQNKNEILGKVVLPVKKLAQQYFGKELPLVCSWGITDYYLRLDHDESIRIGVITKLQG